MSTIKVNIVMKDPEISIPSYQTPASAGMDISAATSGTILPGERKLVPTGLCVEIPDGYEGQVRPRSGLAIHYGIGMLNAPGTIDSDYRGEISVILFNGSNTPFHYQKGDRVAQLIFCPVARAELNVVKKLTGTQRGDKGFGSTGVKSADTRKHQN